MTYITDHPQRDYQLELINRLASKPGLRGRIDAKCIECIYAPMTGVHGDFRSKNAPARPVHYMMLDLLAVANRKSPRK